MDFLCHTAPSTLMCFLKSMNTRSMYVLFASVKYLTNFAASVQLT